MDRDVTRAHPGRASVSSQRTTHTVNDTGRDVAPEQFNDPILDPARPRQWQASTAHFSRKIYRQLLGLNPFKSSYFALYRSLESNTDRLVAIIGAICAIAAGLPLPLISTVFRDVINSFPPSEEQIRQLIIKLVSVAAAYFVVTAIYTAAFAISSEKISISLRQKLLDCLLHLDQTYMDTHEIDVSSLLAEKIDTIHAGCSEKVGIFIQSIAYFIAAFTVGFILSPRLTGILLAAVIPTMILVVSTTSRGVSKAQKAMELHNERANSIVESALRSVKVAQAFDMMADLCDEHIVHLNGAVKEGIRKAIVSAFQLGAIFFMAYSINALAFFVGSRMANEGHRGGEAGTVFAVVLLILDSSFVVAQFAPYMDIFARATAVRETLQDLFDARKEIENHRTIREVVEDFALNGQQIVVRNVSFAYPSRPTVRVLEDLNLDIQPGKLTAIVGTSGGGKSTLLSLLTGIYDYSGSIKFGLHELRGSNIINIRHQISVVEQEPFLFSGTIYDNICNGLDRSEYTEEELNRRCDAAAKQAAVDFLDDLPHGIHTRIGNELQLSGGQRQRISLARALIRKPAIIVLDEPTSALDAHSEVLVMEAVKTVAASGTTVIMIAHRLSTVLGTDKVIVISDGHVVEHGSPSDLSREGSVFRGLLDAQRTNVEDWTMSEKTLESSESGSPSSNSASATDKRNEYLDSAQEPQEVIPPLGLGVVISQFWRIIQPDSFLIVGGLLASIISGALLVAEALIFGAIISLLNQNPESSDFLSRANFLCLMFFIIALVALGSWVCSGTAFGVASTRSVVRVQTKLLHHFLYLDIEWFSSKGHSVHNLLSAFTKDTGDLSCLSGPALGTIFTTTTSVVSGIILAHIIAWKIAVVLLSAVPIMIVAGFLRLKVLGSADTRRRTAYMDATSLAAEACRARRTVSIFGLEGRILERYTQELKEPYAKGIYFIIGSNLLLAVSFAVTYFVYALAYWWGSRQVRYGMYSEQQFFTVLPALLFSAQSAGQLFSLSPEIARAKSAATSIFELLSSKSTILSSPTGKIDSAMSSAENLPANLMQPGATPKIAFEEVSLAYDPTEKRMALQNASFAIPRGKTVALVGPSGAGKSSTIGLIERFYDVTSGVVKFDGMDIRKMNVSHMRNRIGLVSQEPDLFPGTIAHNIRLGAADDQTVTEGDIEAVCKQCGLHDFIMSLPEGYSTECSSNGSAKLSGGQQQRLALARALVRKPEVLLLDEFSSALDAHSERHVHDAVAAAAQECTVVIVAHRLASIKEVDKIFVFNRGTVVEEGTHDELVLKGGLYYSMAKAQRLV
ncbi:multidrug resistance protein 1-like protein [Acrodontium crateriforme]|uniref:Multidrug resistance protein 1-like protein n=1 Tax=Acrodontium crateriforme TaxID=150365 RepID=A0AAQ3M3Y3_9PEZI|nr:multidrug resistance protein 1-like protein [Acrodontium crateriforme]